MQGNPHIVVDLPNQKSLPEDAIVIIQTRGIVENKSTQVSLILRMIGVGDLAITTLQMRGSAEEIGHAVETDITGDSTSKRHAIDTGSSVFLCVQF